MVTRKTGRPVGRPPDPEKADAIVEAAWTLFLARGVEGVALETVAARAGVSKVTLYKHFPDKAALFQAGVLREVQRIEAAQSAEARQSVPGQPEASDLRATLRHFGVGLMAYIFSDPAVDFYKALAGELRRHQALAQVFYDTGPGRTRAALAALLAAARDRGELRFDDPELAAEHLFGLWQGFSNLQLALGVEARRIRANVEARVDAGLDAFLRAYAVPQ